MSFDDRGFSKIETTQGTLVVNMMGNRQEMPFEAELWRDSEGTVGAVNAETPRGPQWMFVSLTDGGAVYTQGGPRDGNVDIDGDTLVTTTASDRDGVLAAHLTALGDDGRSDPDALLDALRNAPQKAVDLAGEVMKRLASGLSQS